MSCPLLAIILLKPVTAISRPIIMQTIQAGIHPREVSIIKDVETRTLSATGSITFPKLDTNPLCLAKNPSKKSVMAAAVKISAAKNVQILLGNISKITISGTAATRNSVKLLGWHNIFFICPPENMVLIKFLLFCLFPVVKERLKTFIGHRMGSQLAEDTKRDRCNVRPH